MFRFLNLNVNQGASILKSVQTTLKMVRDVESSCFQNFFGNLKKFLRFETALTELRFLMVMQIFQEKSFLPSRSFLETQVKVVYHSFFESL